MTTTREEYKAVVEMVRHWTAPEQFALLHELLQMVAPEEGRANAAGVLARRRDDTLSRAIGIGAGTGPPPSDGEVKQWIEEWRLEKYR